MHDKLLRIAAVKEITGKSRSAIYADMVKGIFPKSILIGERSVAWSEADINAWVQATIKKSRAVHTPKSHLRPWELLSKADLAREVLKAHATGSIHVSEI